jgi:lipoyl synthase
MLKSVSRPPWLKKKVRLSEHLKFEKLFGGQELHTICREARCPNITECFAAGEASFLIMGAACTRECTFCNVAKEVPGPLDDKEPERLADMVRKLGLRHVVITSPTRDDLPDGGAMHFVKTAEKIKELGTGTVVEFLIPDLKGNQDHLQRIADSQADIIGHNLETVRRLYYVRKGADYDRSLEVLDYIRQANPNAKTKTGIMLGLGETFDEVTALFKDSLDRGCRWISIGQYLAPSLDHYPVAEYVTEERFEEYKRKALEMGFDHVESGAYVRSSYHASNYMDNN